MEFSLARKMGMKLILCEWRKNGSKEEAFMCTYNMEMKFNFIQC